MNPFHRREYKGKIYYLLLFFLLVSGCTSEEKRNKKENLKAEFIFRKHDEFYFSPPMPQAQKPPVYPWEKNAPNGLHKITKDFFRCKGSASHPVLKVEKGEKKDFFRDCPGGKQHGLPLRDGKEFIYPCLMDLLNYVQDKTGKKVVITTGHRCPQHNAYCDPSPGNWGSKHMLGAEVDFYVDSLENQPEQIVSLLQQFYKEKYSNQKEYHTFTRYEKEGLNVKTAPWYNKEVFIKLYREDEGRDFDNRHPYAYIGVQVRFDREKNEKVVFDGKLTENYLRH